MFSTINIGIGSTLVGITNFLSAYYLTLVNKMALNKSLLKRSNRHIHRIYCNKCKNNLILIRISIEKTIPKNDLKLKIIKVKHEKRND